MLILTVLFAIMIFILLFLLVLQKYELKNIVNQLKKISGEDTNSLINAENGTANELINEINKLLKELRRNRIMYQRKNHDLEQMITNISHDLRTPLTSAMGYINIIQTSNLTEDEKSRELDIIERRLVRLEELINSFFEFSKIISSDKPPEKENINLVLVLEESIVHYYDDYCGRNREIIFICEKHNLTIYSNKNMLIRIFDNLIGNSLKHGVGNLSIIVNADDNIKISFENEYSESGIDAERIFDEFYTTDISRTKGNTGLGLAIAKQFTELLGGSISAEIKEGTFLLNITFM